VLLRNSLPGRSSAALAGLSRFPLHNPEFTRGATKTSCVDCAMIAALFHIVNAASEVMLHACCATRLPRICPVPATMPRCVDLYPAFTERRIPFASFNEAKGFIVRGLACFYAAGKRPIP
jgi:hypothetical protein